MQNNIKITLSTETIELENALIGGRVDDISDSPIALYCGSLDLDEIHTCLFYINRSVSKLLTDEFGFPIEHAEQFLLSALSEAITQEYNVKISGVSDMDVQKVVKTNWNT